MFVKIPKNETRTLEQLREHYEFQKYLTNNLRNASRGFNNIVTSLVTTENRRQAVNIIPRNIRTKIYQFTSDDLHKLNLDTVVNKLYEDEEFKCGLVGAWIDG